MLLPFDLGFSEHTFILNYFSEHTFMLTSLNILSAYISYDCAGSSSKNSHFADIGSKREPPLTFSKFEGERKLLVETNSLD